MRCRDIKGSNIVWFGKYTERSNRLVLSFYTGAVFVYDNDNFGFENDYFWVNIGSSTIEYTPTFTSTSRGTFTVEGSSTVEGTFYWTNVPVSNYASSTDAIVASLTQRLNVIKGELWYQINYGLPLTEKYKSKNIFDATIQEIILSHPDVAAIESFESNVSGHTYTYNVLIRSIYGKTFELSNIFNITPTLTYVTASASNPSTITVNGTATLRFTANNGYKLTSGSVTSLVGATLVSWTIQTVTTENDTGILVINNPTADITFNVTGEALPIITTFLTSNGETFITSDGDTLTVVN